MASARADPTQQRRYLLTELLLTTERLSCEREAWPLFDALSFRLQAGGALQVVGPNGSGKTTLLRTLAGLRAPAGGRILWRGRPVGRQRWSLGRDLLYLGHQPGVKRGLSPRENLHWLASLGSAVTGDPARALARVGLAGLEDTPCDQLSAGQLRRVALARLYASSARLWLLDEPFTAIDRAGVEQLQTCLADHCRSGGAVILTSHQPVSLPNLERLDLAEFPAPDPLDPLEESL